MSPFPTRLWKILFTKINTTQINYRSYYPIALISVLQIGQQTEWLCQRARSSIFFARNLLYNTCARIRNGWNTSKDPKFDQGEAVPGSAADDHTAGIYNIGTGISRPVHFLGWQVRPGPFLFWQMEMVKVSGLVPIPSSVPFSRTRTTPLSFPSVNLWVCL
jgi:hypothetical protein